jgi:hypothetical protein
MACIQKQKIRVAAISILLTGVGYLLPVHGAQAQDIPKEGSIELENIKAPPRDIKDILKVLEQAKPDQEIVDKSRAIIAMSVPQTNDKEEQNKFCDCRCK